MRSIVVLALSALVAADVYMHNPRGSNDRHNEANQNRQNANHLFDSQNNAKGGYCYGPPLAFYESSELTVEWTAQHSCNGEGKTQCEFIIQYMCSDNSLSADPTTFVRDGTTTETIPDDPTAYNAFVTGTTDVFMYGMHEDYMYYQGCKARERNNGLFIGDATVNGNDARFTRQNNNANRHGFECPEERDYYPYWHPTPWKDIAVLTSDTSRCSYYKQYSQNNGDMSWGWCQETDGSPAPENYEQACMAASKNWMTWNGWSSNSSIKAPECIKAPWSRDNHLGNVPTSKHGNYAAVYNWTIPGADVEPCVKSSSCNCVLRLRYNITTDEIDGWPKGGDLGDQLFHDYTFNGANSPVQDDPYVEVAGKMLRLEMNPNQYGRTFQDRSYVFNILPRPTISPVAKIYNLNVRGRRGNIVECYPSVEYDFVPNQLHVKQFDFVHFQWTGCDTNAANEAGQGQDQTDRSNIVQIKGMGYNMPITEDDFASGMKPMFESETLRAHFAYLDQVVCDSLDYLNTLSDDQAEESPTNCMYLNSAPAYFNGGLIKMNSTGNFYYMSTRNNNFSNRSQKAAIVVGLPLNTGELAGVVVGGVALIALSGGLAAFLYGRSHPHTKVGGLVSRVTNK